MRGRRILLRVVFGGALLAAIGAAAVIVVHEESPQQRRLREIAHAASRVPECGSAEVDKIDPKRGDPGPHGLLLIRDVSCGPPDNLGPGVIVEVFATQADVAAEMAAGQRDTYGSEQCATKTERFDLEFFMADSSNPNSVKIARGWDRDFCRRVGAAPPVFTGAFLKDGDS